METIKFYPQEAPQQGDTVIVKVTKVTDDGVYGKLLEYPNYQGLILLSEMSRRRIRSITQLTRVGKLEVCAILRVDTSTKLVDLSKKQVGIKDSELATEKYHKTKQVLSFLLQIAQEVNVPVHTLVETIVYPLFIGRHHPLDVFEMVSAGKEFREIYSQEVYETLDYSTLTKLTELIKKKLVIKPYYIRADINCFYSGAEGVEVLKEVFRKVDSSVKVRYISAPKYIFETQNTNVEEGIGLINESINTVKEYLEAKGGNVSIVEPARVMGEEDKDRNLVADDLDDSETDEESMDDSNMEFVE